MEAAARREESGETSPSWTAEREVDLALEEGRGAGRVGVDWLEDDLAAADRLVSMGGLEAAEECLEALDVDEGARGLRDVDGVRATGRRDETGDVDAGGGMLSLSVSTAAKVGNEAEEVDAESGALR
jgi:hypothetical protein